MTRPSLRNRHRLVPLALLGALTFGSSCTKKEEPAKQDDPKQADTTKGTTPGSDVKTPLPDGPVANPTDSPAVAEAGEVVATLQVPTGIKMTDIAAVLDSMQPGLSTMMQMQLPDALQDAAGFDIAQTAKLDGPISFVVLNPASHPQPLALLVEAKDAAALTEAAKGAGHAVEQRDNMVLIGPADVVSAAKDFAFANLTKYPDHSEIIIYPKLLLSSYASKMEEGMAASMAMLGGANQGLGQMMTNYVKGVVALGEQSERIVLSVSAGQGSADLIARLYPVAGSTLASFVEAQVPSQHTLLGKLPAGGGMMTMSGDWRAGAARDALLNFGIGVMAPMYTSVSADQWLTLFKPWIDNLDGSFAMNMDMSVGSGLPTMQFQTVWGITDAEAMRKTWREMFTLISAGGLEVMGMKFTNTLKPDVLTHDGVGIDLYESKIDTSALPPDQAEALTKAGAATNQSMHFATFDKLAAIATADADGKAMTGLIDAARGKGGALEISGQFATVLDASKQRGDSMLMYFDIGAMMSSLPTPPPAQMPFRAMSWGVGKHEGALSMRISLIK